jgi:hypothetical protein
VFGLALLDPAGQVVLGALVVAQPDDDDPVQGHDRHVVLCVADQVRREHAAERRGQPEAADGDRCREHPSGALVTLDLVGLLCLDLGRCHAIITSMDALATRRAPSLIVGHSARLAGRADRPSLCGPLAIGRWLGVLSRVMLRSGPSTSQSAEASGRCAFAITIRGPHRWVTNGPGWHGGERPSWVSETVVWSNGGAVMPAFIWIAVALMLIGAVMLVADIGAPALWIAVITVGIALVAIDRIRARRSLSS